ncbi:MAG: MBL fold metallo-hydrolase [Bacteroidota bacterium]
MLVLTHDHYDHLDYTTVLKLKAKTKRICASLGVGSHLRYWGFDPAVITELDWWRAYRFLTIFI